LEKSPSPHHGHHPPSRQRFARCAPALAKHCCARLGMLVVYAARCMATPVLRGLAGIPAVRRLIELALDEDLGRGDATSLAVFGNGGDGGGGGGPRVVAEMNAREPI